MRVVISGYYGFDNAGDEAILEATIDGIVRHIRDADIVVLSAQPGATARKTGVTAVSRSSLRAILQNLTPGGLLVSGGGGLLQDSTSSQSIFYYLGVLQLAQLRKMKTIVHAQGIGPLTKAASRSGVRFVLRRVNQITVRDRASAKLLKDLNVTDKALLTADPVFGLKPATTYRAQEILAAEGVPKGSQVLAVALRSWADLGVPGRIELGAALARVAEELKLHILFVSMHRPDDLTIARELAGRVRHSFSVIQGAYTPAELAAVVGASRAVLAMRLHAIIFGALSGVPSVPLSYDPKVDSIARQLELEPLHLEDLQADALFDSIRKTLSISQSQRDRLVELATSQRRLAEEGFIVMEMLARR